MSLPHTMAHITGMAKKQKDITIPKLTSQKDDIFIIRLERNKPRFVSSTYAKFLHATMIYAFLHRLNPHICPFSIQCFSISRTNHFYIWKSLHHIPL